MIERRRRRIRRSHVLEKRDDDLAELRCWSAADHAVEVVRIPLDFHQPLTTTVGTAVEVRVARLLAVECAGHHLGDFRGTVDTRESEVELSLRLVERPASAAAGRRLVTGVRADGDVAVRRAREHRAIDRAGVSAVAPHEETLIPLRREHHGESNLTRDHSRYATVWRANVVAVRE